MTHFPLSKPARETYYFILLGRVTALFKKHFQMITLSTVAASTRVETAVQKRCKLPGST